MLDYIAMALDPSLILKARGMQVDPWQHHFLSTTTGNILLNCSRQAGKSTVVSALGLHRALYNPNSTVLILSPGQRQSSELFKKVIDNYNAIGRPLKATYETQLKIELQNGSRVLCMPGKEETIRGYSPNLIIIDEAARVADDLYRSVRPMLAVTRGRLVALSTPFGQRGFFYDEWEATNDFLKIKVSWKDCPRISPDFIKEETRAMGEGWVQQEYECLFTALEGLVYPDFTEKTHTDFWLPPQLGQPVGGIDWGWRNPFAAVWGVLDREDVLHIQEERYLRETALHEHAAALPKGMMWYADPAGATEIDEFRAAGHKIRKGYNDIRLGIAAITARMRTNRLRVNPHRCPNLVAEAKLYRYPSQQERSLVGENPVDEHNHALGALRYLISRVDSRFIAKLRGKAKSEGRIELDQIDNAGDETIEQLKQEATKPITKKRWEDPAMWTSLN